MRFLPFCLAISLAATIKSGYTAITKASQKAAKGIIKASTPKQRRQRIARKAQHYCVFLCLWSWLLWWVVGGGWLSSHTLFSHSSLFSAARPYLLYYCLCAFSAIVKATRRMLCLKKQIKLAAGYYLDIS